MTTYEPTLRNGTPNRGYLALDRRWLGRDGATTGAGENGRGAKLTEADVLDILARPTTGPDRQTARQVAEEFGVSVVQVKRIRRGEAWGHLRGRVAS